MPAKRPINADEVEKLRKEETDTKIETAEKKFGLWELGFKKLRGNI